MKADSGTGRHSIDLISGSFLNGFHFFPGLPNGTEAGQEMDQLFAAFQRALYSNRDKLFKKLMSVHGSKAALAMNDISYIIYGGKRAFDDGSSIDLLDCVASYMTPFHIRAARLKCGYCPANRNALKHSLTRHESVVGEDNEIDLDADPLGELLAITEQNNQDAAKWLQHRGYEHATEGARTLRRVLSAPQTPEAQNRITRTEPNTREHQDQLMKCNTAGLHFRLTGGGDLVTSSDWIL